MKNRILNFLHYLSIGKYLIIISFIIFSTSCEKEISHPNHTYSFQDYFFIENVECYDTIGNRLDSLSYMYSQNDFTFSDGFELPYEKIEIKADSTVILHYTLEGIGYIKNGIVTQKNDTLYFFSSTLSINDLLFKGLMIDNQLRIPGFGSIFYTFCSNGYLDVIEETKTIKLGIPDLQNLLQEFPSPSLVYHNIKIQSLYIQRFDLIYEFSAE